MDKPTTIEQRELQVTETFINQDITLVSMPGLDMCDFYVEGDKGYIVHFLNPDVFGQEFATISKGNNLFTVVNRVETECYLFEGVQLRDIVAGVEGSPMKKSARKPSGTVSPCTGPIIIPPNKGQNPH